jgi:hypothetical protein
VEKSGFFSRILHFFTHFRKTKHLIPSVPKSHLIRRHSLLLSLLLVLPVLRPRVDHVKVELVRILVQRLCPQALKNPLLAVKVVCSDLKSEGICVDNVAREVSSPSL